MSYLESPKRGLKHGKNYTYTRYGCKCSLCQFAHQNANMKYKAKSYTLIKAYKSRCVSCETTLYLLCHMKSQSRYAQFFICWNCRKIFEAGRGEILEEGGLF